MPRICDRQKILQEFQNPWESFGIVRRISDAFRIKGQKPAVHYCYTNLSILLHCTDTLGGGFLSTEHSMSKDGAEEKR